MNGASLCLELKQVEKYYGKNAALCGVSAEFIPGIYGLLGPNGAGKSTLMNILAGILPPSGGQVLWNGQPISRLGAEYRSRLGFVPQQQRMYDFFTGYEFMEYMAALKGLDRHRAPAQIELLLAEVELSEHANKKIGAYSGGMKQRLLLAQALLGSPERVLLDEPTAGLDPRQRVVLRELISRIGQQKIVFFATHVVSDLETVAKKVLFLKAGRLVQIKTAAELATRGTLEEMYLACFGTEREGQDGKFI